MPTEPSRRLLGSRFVRLTEEGETFVGTLTDRKPMMFGENHTYQYTFDSDGIKYKMNGTDQLDEALAEVELDTMVEIKYIETVRTLGGFNVKRFEVWAIGEEE